MVPASAFERVVVEVDRRLADAGASGTVELARSAGSRHVLLAGQYRPGLIEAIAAVLDPAGSADGR